MGWFDDHPILEGLGETALNVVGAIPAYGNVLSAGELAYHAIADDTSTPEARQLHNANMASAGVGLIPYVGEVAHGASAINNAIQTGRRAFGGASAEEAPMTNHWLSHSMPEQTIGGAVSETVGGWMGDADRSIRGLYGVP